MARPIQKLIIPSFTYQIKHLYSKNLSSEIQRDIPEDAAGATGILMAGLLPFKTVLRRGGKPSVSVEKNGGITVVRQHGKALIPLRFIRPDHRAQAICRLGMEAYEAYFETAGRPDIVYAYDCLYAGVIARMLHTAYDIPYIVIENKLLNKTNSKALLNIAREVLLEASAVHVLGLEPYRQLKEEFGDLDVIKNAMVV